MGFGEPLLLVILIQTYGCLKSVFKLQFALKLTFNSTFQPQKLQAVKKQRKKGIYRLLATPYQGWEKK